jgi:HK97 family phage portal protein
MFEKIAKFFNLNKKSLNTGETLSLLKAGVDRSDIDYYEGWVYACVNKIAKGFAQVEWQLYQQKSKEVVELDEHPLLSLMNRFNPKFTRYDSLELMAIYYSLFGRCPLLMIAPEGSTKPSELWVIPPQYLTVASKDAEGYALTYRYTVGTKSTVIDAGLVLDIRNPDPSNPANAFGLIKPLRPVADTDYFAKLWNKNLLINQAQPTGVVEIAGTMDDKEARQLRRMLEETYSGFENAHRLMILKNGATMKPFSLSPTDMDFQNMRTMNRDEICALFGVPKILLGLDSGYNRATAETAEMVFAKYTLQPMLTKIVEQINEFLTPLFGAGLWIDFDYLVPADKEFELKEREVGYNKWLTPNEIRRDVGLPELTGGDVIYGSLVSVPQIGVGGQKSAKEAVHEMKLDKPNKGVPYLKAKRLGGRIKARDYRLKHYGIDMAEIFEQKITNLKLDKKVLTIKTGESQKKNGKKKSRN